MSKVAQAVDWDVEAQPWSDPYWAGDIPVAVGLAFPVIRSTRSSKLDECPLRIWEMPKPFSAYTLAVDPCSGKENGDPAAIQVVDMNGCQVAEMILRAADMESQFKAAEWLAYFFNEAKMVIEVNSFGLVLARMFQEYGYRNLYIDEGRVGWLTSVRTRALMIGTMRAALLEKRPILRSKRLKNELLAFVDGGPADDDLTMAMMIAYQCK